MIIYCDDRIPAAADVADVFKQSGIKRPADDLGRLERMVANADLVLTAWDGERLVGLARALTDYSYCCYLSDLAVSQAYQQQGIGNALVERLRAKLSEEVSLVLLSAPGAVDYYPKLGFEKNERCFTIGRKR